MKVIFIKDLKGKGKKNEVKEFSDGYATNFLIKNNYAVKYTDSSSKRLDKDLKELELTFQSLIRYLNLECQTLLLKKIQL